MAALCWVLGADLWQHPSLAHLCNLPVPSALAGGMERPRDDHKLTHNVKLATRDKLFGGTVSRLQVGAAQCRAPAAAASG